jgi:hypothetical protein
MKNLIARALGTCIAAWLTLASANAVAADASEPRGAITLAQALDAALKSNPELTASRYELTAAQVSA